MKRVFKLFTDMKNDYSKYEYIELARYRREFKKANSNRLEPEYKDLAKSSFEPIIDGNI